MTSNTPTNNAPTQNEKRKKLSLIFWLICSTLLLIGFLVWVFIFQYEAYTDDAYVEGNQVYITPLVSGFITAIHTDDTFLVKKGQLLVELDTTDADIALDQTKKDLANAVREICQAFHQVFAYDAEIKTKKAELIRTAQDYKHREDVIDAVGVSLEDFQHSIAALRAGYYSLKTTESLYHKALALVQGTSIMTHPLVQRAADQMRNMWVQRYRCHIYAPVEGLVAQRKIQVGMWVDAGKPLFSVIPLDQIWINANYKETQMKKMRIGQKVKITSDYYGDDTIFHGTVVGLPGAAGNAFALLPPQNLSGNWIKIVQRVPVRVALDPKELKEHPLRIGLSMETVVDLSNQEGIFVPTSTEGSPSYITSIFEKELNGVSELIDVVVKENLDPSLTNWAETTLHLKTIHVKKEIDDFLIHMGIPIEILTHEAQ